MSHISESIPDLLGGVSQLAPQRREVNEVESMVNCQLRPAEGVTKRPPTRWVAEVAPTSSAYTGAFVHAINKNANERFWVIMLDGDLKVFNAVSGVEIPVTFPDGVAYLNVVGTPNEKFRLATFNDTTVIVNRETVVDQAAELSSTRGHEAFVFITQTDWLVTYKMLVAFSDAPGLEGSNSVIADHTIGGPEAGESALETTAVAAALEAEATAGFLGENNLGILNFERIGSGIHITAGPNLAPDFDFTITVEDGLGGQGMQVLQGAVQSTDQLPSEAPVGFIIKVEGSPEKTLDDVYYEFTESGAWKEVVKDGIPIALDPTTLPLELVANPDFTTESTNAQVPKVLDLPGPLVNFGAALLETADGSASTAGTRQISPSPGTTEQKFYNLASASGGTVNFHLDFMLNTSKLVGGGVNPKDPSGAFIAGDRFDWQVHYDVGAGFVLAESEPITAQGTADLHVTSGVNIPLCVAGTDVRVSLVSTAGNLGSVSLTPVLLATYGVPLKTLLTFPSTHYAPNTVLTATINGTAWTHTFTAGGTRAALLAELKTDIEAYGGQAVTVVTAEDAFSGSINITNDDGTEPTFTSFVFDDGLDLTLNLFNGTVDFTTLGLAVGDIVTNTTDSSAATVSAIAATIVTHSALAGGVNDVWADADGVNIKKTTTAFICRQPEWAKRLVGSLETNKWPSFKDGTINEVAFLKNRLVFLSDENVTMSEVDGFFNFFRSSTIDVLDGDRIDVALAGNKASALHSAFTWNETLLTWSELGQFVVNGEPFLSPNTVRREATTAYLNTRKVKPVTSERAVYFLTEGTEFCQLWDYKPTSEDATSAEGNRLSVKVPRFMPGTPRGLLAVSDPEVVLVLTSTDPEKLYVYSHLIQDQQRLMGGWHEWEFNGVTQILGMGSIDNEISLIFVRDDGTVNLEVIDLWELSEQVLDAQEDSDDQTTPPAFGPVVTTLGLDTYVEAGTDVLLSAHTSDSGFGTWSTGITETGATTWNGAYISQAVSVANALTMSTSAGAGGYRCSGIIGDGDMEFFVDCRNTSTTPGRFPMARFLVNASESGAYYQKGMGIGIDWVAASNSVIVVAKRHHNGGMIESSDIATVALAVGNTMRFGFRRVGLVFSYYRADVGTGENEVALGSFTMGSISNTGLAELSDGTNRGFHLFSESAYDIGSGDRWEWDNLTVQTTDPVNTSTVFTPRGPGCGIAIDPDGVEVTLVENGDGTCSWPNVDQTGVNIVMGLSVAASIQLTRLFHRKNFGPFAGRAEVRGATYINNLLVGLEDTSTMAIAIAITGHTTFSQDLTELRSLDGEYMHCRVGGRNTETTITFTSSDATNFKIVGIDWEGIYYNRTRRMS